MSSITGALTGGLIDPGSAGYGKAAKRAERRRQALIGSGRDLIDSVFYGGSAPVYSPVMDSFNKNTWQQSGKGSTFYHPGKDGEFEAYHAPKRTGSMSEGELAANAALASTAIGFAPIAIGGFEKLFGSELTPRQRVNKKINRGQLFTKEDQTFEGFTPDFFNQRSQDYINFAMPELQSQYGDNFRSIMYNMANRGLTRSSVADQAKSDLNVTAGKAAQQIADTGRSQAQQLQRDVENSRQSAIEMLHQSANPGEAVQSAISSASQFRTPSSFAPLSNMFSNLANQYYMNQVLSQYRGGVPAYSVNMNSNPLASALPENS